jgi:hypothetical protein
MEKFSLLGKKCYPVNTNALLAHHTNCPSQQQADNTESGITYLDVFK